MERRFHADDPVHGRAGDRQPGSVTNHGRGPGRTQPVPASSQLPFGDVHRHQPARPDHVGDQRILGAKPVSRVEAGVADET